MRQLSLNPAFPKNPRDENLVAHPNRPSGKFRHEGALPGLVGILPNLRLSQSHCGRDARAPREKTVDSTADFSESARISTPTSLFPNQLRAGRPRSQGKNAISRSPQLNPGAHSALTPLGPSFLPTRPVGWSRRTGTGVASEWYRLGLPENGLHTTSAVSLEWALARATGLDSAPWH